LRITDRAYLINKGEILIEGTPAKILAHPDSRKIYFGRILRYDGLTTG
jgi:ABC-type lipopolysaccharide export system ATPase subunit